MNKIDNGISQVDWLGESSHFLESAGVKNRLMQPDCYIKMKLMNKLTDE